MAKSANQKKTHTHTHALTFLQEGVGFVSKNLRTNSEGFILNENKEMAKSAKRPKNTRLSLHVGGRRLHFKKPSHETVKTSF
jgi:hypothetical protein